MALRVIEADYGDPAHAEHVLLLTQAYAQDPMGGGTPLPPDVAAGLVAGLRASGNASSFIAYDGDRPVGIATCFLTFSTFTARRVINIHDLAVLPPARGRGVGAALIDAVTAKARQLDCSKVTLEVLENNAARRLYERCGFDYGEPRYLFMTRRLDHPGE